MGRLISIGLLLFPCLAFANYDWKVLRAIDGDTVEVQANWLPPELGNKIKIRILGVDTPEKAPRAQCDSEAAKAKTASEFTKGLLANAKNVSVHVKGWDKYGGRVLGDIIIDGKSLRLELIAKGHAREYFGEAKQSWCN